MSTGIGAGIAGQVFNSKPGAGITLFSNLFSIYFNGVDESLRSSTLKGPDFGDTDFSFSFWLKPDTDTSGNERLMHKVGGTHSWQIYIDNSQKVLWYGGGSSDSWNDQCSIALTLDVWQHITYAVDRSGLASYYFNGVFADSKDVSAATASFDAGTNFFVGRNGGGQYKYNGFMDELCFFDKCLSASEAAEVYNATGNKSLNSISCASNLTHWFRMGDPIGPAIAPVIPNSSGSSNSNTFDLDFFENMDGTNVRTDAPTV